MNNFVDYYALLEISPAASASSIKGAFKKLALRYHPDIYKGEDAEERMRSLLQAYKTLNDPVARKQYDLLRSEHYPTTETGSGRAERTTQRTSAASSRQDASAHARGDRKRQYAFPDFSPGKVTAIQFADRTYQLSVEASQEFVHGGIWRGKIPIVKDQYYCHRCHHHWAKEKSSGPLPRFCPQCWTGDWSEVLLLRCIHCCAVFESEQIRYEVGSFSYASASSTTRSGLCPPYELFPLCPYCRTAHWSPAEDERVQGLRREVRQRTTTRRILWMGAVMIILVLLVFVAFGMLH